MITKITPFMRITLIILQVTVLLLTPFWLLAAGHYFFYPMPQIFDFPSLIPTTKNPPIPRWSQINIQQTLWNVFLISLFFFQHVIMATLKYKLQNKKIWKSYPIYERLIYNIISSFLLPIIFYNSKPQNYILFTLDWNVCIVVALIGWVIWIQSNMRVMGRQLLPFSFRSLVKEDELWVEDENEKRPRELVKSGSYALIRHPMVTGFWMFFTFGNNVFTFEKVVVMIVFLIGMIFGSIMQENKLLKANPLYHKYMKQVKSRYIPFII